MFVCRVTYLLPRNNGLPGGELEEDSPRHGARRWRELVLLRQATEAAGRGRGSPNSPAASRGGERKGTGNNCWRRLGRHTRLKNKMRRGAARAAHAALTYQYE